MLTERLLACAGSFHILFRILTYCQMFHSTKMKRKSLLLHLLNFLIKWWITIAAVQEKENPAHRLHFGEQPVWSLKPAPM